MTAKSGRLPRGEGYEHDPLGGRSATREHPPAHPTYCGPILITMSTFAEAAPSGNMRPRHDDQPRHTTRTLPARAIHARHVRNAGMAAREGSNAAEGAAAYAKPRPPNGEAGPTTEANRPMSTVRPSCAIRMTHLGQIARQDSSLRDDFSVNTSTETDFTSGSVQPPCQYWSRPSPQRHRRR